MPAKAPGGSLPAPPNPSQDRASSRRAAHYFSSHEVSTVHLPGHGRRYLRGARGALESQLERALSNQRMKLARRGGHFWWNAQGKPSFLIVAAPPRSLCAIR